MTKAYRDPLYAGCMLAAAALGVVGIVLFWAAGSFEGYIGALLVLAIAAVCFVAGRDLRASGAEADKAASPGSST